MVDNDKIVEIMLGMVHEEAKKLYSEKVIDYGVNPISYGIMKKPDGYAEITGPCGDTVEMFLRVRNGKIEETKFSTDGCIFTIAACSAASVMAQGKAIRDCLKINQGSILAHLEGMPEDHEHCALLAALTFHKALRNFIINRKH
jgi:nitrogen fixation NifU-like protein